jgi:subtilisin family serine protease/NADPH-dependent ferric siderophore reductase
MKRWVGVAATLIAGVLFATTSAQGPAAPPGPEFVPGEVLVQYRAASSQTRRDAIVSARAARLLRRYRQLDMDRLQLPAGANLDAAMAALRATPDVVGVSANYVRHAIATPGPPNDPFWTSSQMWGLIKIQAQSVWNTLGARGDGSVVIMDIDTGVNYNHEDLAANIWTNPNEIPGDGIDNDGDGYVDDVHGINAINGAVKPGDPLDDEGHGTHTAGTLAAVGNNGVGVVGVNWNAKILACKFLDSSGSGSDGDAIECLNYAVTLKTLHNINIRVTNNSWGGRRLGGPVPTMLQAAFDAAGNAGILNVVAAGNNGFNIELPNNAFDPASLAATSPSIIAVASTGQTDALSSFSNWGSHTVALAAPGEGIISTYFDPTHPANNTYASADGTSMATPHVAGTAALLSSMDPTLTVAQLEALLESHVDVIAGLANKVITGGRLNAFNAASGVGVVNHAPSAVLTGPPNNSTYTAPATVPITATASDPDVGDTIDHVTFYANGNSIGTVTTPVAGVYSFSWASVAAGSYSLTAIATDNHGLAGVASNAIAITVNTGGGGTAVQFVTDDATTQGSWIGAYGADGWSIVGDTTSLPAYAALSSTGSSYTWATSTSDTRAVLRAGGSSGRLAATWYNASTFTIDVTVTSGAHQVALYGIDWDSQGRSERIDVLDGTTSAQLDTRTLSNFSGGQYLVWNVTGHVKFRATTLSGPNAVISAAFFAPPGPINHAPSATLTGPPNNSSYTIPAPVPLSVTATDPDAGDTIDHVTFYANGNPIATVTTPQAGVYNFSWSGMAAGGYTLTATATDNHGATGAMSNASQVTVTGVGGGASAAFIATDAATQGNWIGTYGADGSSLVGDTTSLPAYAALTSTGTTYTWAASTTDPRALLRAGGSSGRLAATWYSGPSFDLDVNIASGTHQVSLYSVDWDSQGRSERIDVLDAVSSAQLDTRTVSGFSGGVYLAWNVTGHVKFHVTALAGPNAVVSAVFFGGGGPGNHPPTANLTGPPDNSTYTELATVPMSATATDPDAGDTIDHVTFYANGSPIANVTTPTAGVYNLSWMNVVAGSYTITATATDNHGLTGPASNARHIVVNGAGGGNSAIFVSTDTTTQGNWIGAHGPDGYSLVSDATSLPAYAAASSTGTQFTWASSTSDVRALLRAGGSSGRVAAAWYSATSFDLDVNVGGTPHQVALYMVDWDNTNRSERIDVLDATTMSVLDTRTVAGFHGGQYFTWSVTGHVIFRVTRLAGDNAVVSAIFFGG